MAALDHGPAHPAEAEDPRVVARHARIGIWLFAAYLLLYAGFVLGCAFLPAWMALRLWGQINLAVWYGFGLIGAAGVVALIYSWLCRKNVSAFAATHRTAADEREEPS
jgi:uncharacterized membrane protein (DUF485 family)